MSKLDIKRKLLFAFHSPVQKKNSFISSPGMKAWLNIRRNPFAKEPEPSNMVRNGTKYAFQGLHASV
jgi:hypothetical protein